MTTMNATYFANYEDHDGYDEVACLVDVDTLEVVSFDKVASCRWDDNSGAICETESVQLADGRTFDAIKYDEYDDAVAGGYAEEYDRGCIVLFDAGALEAAMVGFAN